MSLFTTLVGRSRTRSVEVVPLRDVDLNSVIAKRIELAGNQPTLPYYEVPLAIAGGRKLVAVTKTTLMDHDTTLRTPTDTTSLHRETAIPAPDMPSAERIAAALRRAVVLCGGKKEAF